MANENAITTIQLKTKISPDTGDTKVDLSEIDLSQGEPLVNTNDNTVIIGTSNADGSKANDSNAIILGNSRDEITDNKIGPKDSTIDSGITITHYDGNKERESIIVKGTSADVSYDSTNKVINVDATYSLTKEDSNTGTTLSLTDSLAVDHSQVSISTKHAFSKSFLGNLPSDISSITLVPEEAALNGTNITIDYTNSYDTATFDGNIGSVPDEDFPINVVGDAYINGVRRTIGISVEEKNDSGYYPFKIIYIEDGCKLDHYQNDIIQSSTKVIGDSLLEVECDVPNQILKIHDTAKSSSKEQKYTSSNIINDIEYITSMSQSKGLVSSNKQHLIPGNNIEFKSEANTSNATINLLETPTFLTVNRKQTSHRTLIIPEEISFPDKTTLSLNCVSSQDLLSNFPSYSFTLKKWTGQEVEEITGQKSCYPFIVYDVNETLPILARVDIEDQETLSSRYSQLFQLDPDHSKLIILNANSTYDEDAIYYKKLRVSYTYPTADIDLSGKNTYNYCAIAVRSAKTSSNIARIWTTRFFLLNLITHFATSGNYALSVKLSVNNNSTHKIIDLPATYGTLYIDINGLGNVTAKFIDHSGNIYQYKYHVDWDISVDWTDESVRKAYNYAYDMSHTSVYDIIKKETESTLTNSLAHWIQIYSPNNYPKLSDVIRRLGLPIKEVSTESHDDLFDLHKYSALKDIPNGKYSIEANEISESGQGSSKTYPIFKNCPPRPNYDSTNDTDACAAIIEIDNDTSGRITVTYTYNTLGDAQKYFYTSYSDSKTSLWHKYTMINISDSKTSANISLPPIVKISNNVTMTYTSGALKITVE